MINHRYPVPFLPVSGQVLDGTTTKVNFGDLYDLAGSVSVGIYDQDTQAIATGTGNGRKFFIGYSSEHTRDFIDKFIFGAQLPKGNSYWAFRGEDVISFEYSNPTKVKNEKWTLGYDGSAGCNITVPKFECGKIYGINIAVSGSPTFRRWAGRLQHEIFTDPICCTDDLCATGCQDNFVDCERITKELAEKINNHVELKQMGVKARYISNTFAATTPNMNKYQITVSDDGSESAMAIAKQSAGADSNIVRVSRTLCSSTYEVCAIAAPTSFTPAATFALPNDCAVCPAGSTTVAASDVYTILRPLAGTEDLTTVVARQAYADLVGTSYTGETVRKFLSQNGAVAVLEFSFPVGTVVTAVLSDTVILVRTQGVQCTLAAPVAVAWVATGTAYRMFRTLCLSLPRKDCAAGVDRLAELQAYYANVSFYKAGSLVAIDDPATAVNTCADTYNLQQWSNGCMEDGCLAYDTAYFTDFGGYENKLWQVVKPTPAVYDATKRCGIEITASVPEQFVNDCEFEMSDFFETEPIRLEVAWINDSLTGFPNNCDMDKLPRARRAQAGNISRQSGEAVLRQYIKAGAYEAFGEDLNNPRLRRVLDSQRRKQVDRAQNYRIYYLQFKVLRQQHNFDQVPEIAEAMFAFPVGDPKALKFEAAILSPLSKFGVTLKERK